MLKHLSNTPLKNLYYGIGFSASTLMLSACGGSDSTPAKEYDGFAAVINGEQEDQIFVHAFSNGKHSQFGVLEKYTPTDD